MITVNRTEQRRTEERENRRNFRESRWAKYNILFQHAWPLLKTFMVKGGLSICFLLCFVCLFVFLFVCLFSCRNDLHSLDESSSVPLAWKRGFCLVLQHIFWWDIMNYQCQCCPLKTRTQKRYLKHLEVYHQSEPYFVIECGQNGCPTTYTKNIIPSKTHKPEAHNYNPRGKLWSSKKHWRSFWKRAPHRDFSLFFRETSRSENKTDLNTIVVGET